MATQRLVPQRDFVEGRRIRGAHRHDFLSRRAPRTDTRLALPPPSPVEREDDESHRVVELLPLVKGIAMKIRGRLPAFMEVDDIVGAGLLGLLDAVRKFDPRKHVKIESYARHRIRGAILDSLRSLDHASRDMREKIKAAEKVARKLEAKLGRPASDLEMAQALRLSLKSWYHTLRELQALGTDWLRPREPWGAKQHQAEALVAEHQGDAFDLCYGREQRDILNGALACLPERERLILTLYYQQELTMKQISAQLGIDESRVSQIHSSILRRLRPRVQGILQPPPARVPAPYMVARPRPAEATAA